MIRLAVSAGCPCGIGPEVAVVAASEPRPDVEVILVGDRGALAEAARLRGVDLASASQVRVQASSDLPAPDREPGHPGLPAGAAQLAAISAALDLVLAGQAEALVTAPVSKAAITRTGVDFRGHTEYLAGRTGTRRVVMMFAGPRLRTSLVTTHLSLRDLPDRITRAGVRETIVLTARALVEDFGLAHPTLAVTGLNPHAGEGGLLGAEEQDVIRPAVVEAAEELGPLAVVAGPLSAEAAFREARDGRWSAVVAMYHDQATIASKLLDFGSAVNVTLGLPLVRTSVDHGTAYDRAGRGTADANGMRAAIDLAVVLARGRRGRR